MPGPRTHRRSSQIVKILAATVAADPQNGAKQKVLLGDPDPVRAEGMASVLRRIGYDVEVAHTGRDLVHRLQEKADADLLIVDRHLPNPMLIDLLPQLRADQRARTLPLWVVASPEGTTPVNLFTALARLAAVVAFEDLPNSPALKLPTAQVKTQELIEQTELSFEQMRRQLVERHAVQVQHMQDVVRRAGFPLTEQIVDRIEYLSIQTFPQQYLDAFGKPLLDQERLVMRRLLPELIRDDLRGNPTSAFKGKLEGDQLPSRQRAAHIVKLMYLSAEEEAALPANQMPAFNRLWDSFWDPQSPKLPVSPPVRYPAIEAKVLRTIAPYRNARMIPAVLSEASMRDELAEGRDPQAPPISPAEKKENAKAAMVWLRKMAVGELPGYKIADAEDAIRGALRSNELAPLAIDALARISSKDAQLDLANLAVANERPVPIRIQAAAALVEHVQAFGRFVTAPQASSIAQSASATEDLGLKARLLAAEGVLRADSKGTGARLKVYVPKAGEAPKGEVPPPKEKEEPKEADDKKE